jgi:very-short-patch-repair endonuclease
LGGHLKGYPNPDIKSRARELRKRSTLSEKKLWYYLRNHKLRGLKFNRQFPICFGDTGKRSYFIADFYCHQHKLIIELDGSIHDLMEEKDQNRTDMLQQLGFNIIRFRNNEIENSIDYVLSTIIESLT